MAGTMSTNGTALSFIGHIGSFPGYTVFVGAV